ncbi:hypothetical protein GCM10009127_13520 [Alteraurantiacibacter aestuarii]|uniref:Uncharacterized protein n=1 Tax=Alteraurantiacibacter aestuarii TaxID=650004 RepID=A0A844ZJU9_9SPHN|nr:hypothetical protein [Alteraurantiacibacter aestuarii]MXO88058.1 hypothetical protein [Alteraurantiacibacter aestuarii]
MGKTPGNGKAKAAQKGPGKKIGKADRTTSRVRTKSQVRRVKPLARKDQRGWNFDHENEIAEWQGRGPRTPLEDTGYGHYTEREQQLLQMPDEHKGGHGGSMKSLRTHHAVPEEALNQLSDVAYMASARLGRYYEGPTEYSGLDPSPVKASVGHRDKNAHRKEFRRATGEASATRYQQASGDYVPGTDYEILHAHGVGEVGKVSQQIVNLASASQGANSQMIPYDKAISGNPRIRVGSYFQKKKGTHQAVAIHQVYYHEAMGDQPIFHQQVEPHRPEMSREEYEYHEAQAERLKQHIRALEGPHDDGSIQPMQMDEEKDQDEDEEAAATMASMSMQRGHF